jgi:hypothetical protein
VIWQQKKRDFKFYKGFFWGKKWYEISIIQGGKKKVEFAISKNFYFALWPVSKPLFFFCAIFCQKTLKNQGL